MSLVAANQVRSKYPKYYLMILNPLVLRLSRTFRIHFISAIVKHSKLNPLIKFWAEIPIRRPIFNFKQDLVTTLCINFKPLLALEARLMSLYFDTKQYNMCLKLGQRLYSELKKLDDKALLVEIQLTESKVSHNNESLIMI